ncbi:recombinase family protein [Kitasatospora cinereorecta]|uniref:Recombinase family protein n=1 Tax=Kitasatospora cinereorecta TaxID=285560 RepID=A0ABW0VHL2_9ACTN
MTEEAQAIPVVSYARISADTAKDGHGVDDQHAVNDQTAARLGWTVVHRFTDNDLSAAKADVVRPDFEAMLEALQVGHLADGQTIKGVIVLVEDRLTRRPGDYERFVEALTYDEGRVFADSKGSKDLYNEDVESMGLFGVVISKMEVRKMQRRQRRSHRRRAELGIPVGGKRPFGWQDDKLTLEPAEAALLAQAVRDVIAGKSLRSILLEWRDAGVKTINGNEWAHRSLKLALWNPRVCGWRKHNGELVRDANGVPVVGRWKPVVTPKEWMAIDAIFSARTGLPTKVDGTVLDPRVPNYLLSGILRCGRKNWEDSVCNAPMRASANPRFSGGFQYVCPSRSMGGCGGTARNGAKVDEFVTEAVLAKLEERAALAGPRVGPWGGESELERLKAKQRKMLQAWQDDLISDELFFPENQRMESRIKELRADQQRHALQQQRATERRDDIRERWFSGRLDVMQKRAIVREALHAVVVMPAGKGRAAFNPDLLVPKWRD